MHGVTTALVSFLLVCVVFPNLVKNRTQYYAAFAAVCLVILLDAFGLAVSGPTVDGRITGFRVFAYVAGAALQVAAMMLLFLAAGGVTWRALASDMKDAYEVIRRGSEDKEIIIPLSGEMAQRRAMRQAEQDEPEHERIVINDPSMPSPASPQQDKPPGSSIPLEP